MLRLTPEEYYDFEYQHQLEIKEFKFYKNFSESFDKNVSSKNIYKHLINCLYSLELIYSHNDETDYENEKNRSYEQMAYFINNSVKSMNDEKLFKIKKCFQLTTNEIKNQVDVESMKLLFNKKLNSFFSGTKYKINVQYYIIDSTDCFSVIIYTSGDKKMPDEYLKMDVDDYHQSIIKNWFENYSKWEIYFLGDDH